MKLVPKRLIVTSSEQVLFAALIETDCFKASNLSGKLENEKMFPIYIGITVFHPRGYRIRLIWINRD